MKFSALVPSSGSLFAFVLGAGVMWWVWVAMEEPDLSPPMKLPEIDAKLLEGLKEYIAWYNAIPPEERDEHKGVGEKPITEEPEKIYRGIQENKWDWCNRTFWTKYPDWRPTEEEGYQPWMMAEPGIFSEISEAPYRACVAQFDRLIEVYGEAELRESYWKLKRAQIAKRLSGFGLVLVAILVVLYASARAAVQFRRRSVVASA